jgi:CHAT domain-containing protein/Tfp pilus assembly protein PilF
VAKRYFTDLFLCLPLIKTALKFFFCLLCFLSAIHSGAQSFEELNAQFLSLFQKGEYQAAIPIGEKALIQARKEFGEADIPFAVANHNLAEAFFELKNSEKALPYYKTAIKTYIRFQKERGRDISLCNTSIGSIFFWQQQFDSSAVYYRKAFDYFINHPENSYDDILVVMNNFSTLYLPIGKYKEAQAVYEKVLKVVEEKEGKENTNYYVTLTNLGTALYNQQLFALAEQYLKQALSIVEKLKGSDNIDYAELLDQLASTIKEQGRAKEAEVLILKGYEIKKSIPDVDIVSMVLSINALASIYTDLADYTKANNYYLEAIALLEKIGAKDSDLYETLLRNFGYYCIEVGRIAEARTVLLTVLELQRKRYGEAHPDNGLVLVMIANTEFLSNELSIAELHVKEGLSILLNLYGKENFSVARSLEVLGSIYHKLGKSNDAIKSYKEAALIYKKILGEENRPVAFTLATLGSTYYDLGKFAEAEIVSKESLKIREKLFGTEHPDYAMSLNNLSTIYIAQGRYTEADALLLNALTIFTKKGLANSNNFLLILNNIAMMAGQQGMYAEAKKIYIKLLENLRAQPDKNYATLLVVLNNLAHISGNEKKYDEAIGYLTESIAYVKKIFGVRNQDYIKSLNNLFSEYMQKGDLLKAQLILEESLPLCKEVMGEKSPILALIYSNASVLAFKRNDLPLASRYIDSSTTLTLQDFQQNFYSLSEKEKLTWWKESSSRFSLAPSYLTLQPSVDPILLANFTDKQLQLKSFVLNDAATALRKARQSSDKKLKELIDKWQAGRTLLTKQAALPVKDRAFSLDSLERTVNDLEKEINQFSAGLLEKNSGRTAWKSIREKLSDNEAAIEFIRFDLFKNNWTDTVQYAAIIIRRNSSSPHFVLLTTETQLAYCLTAGKDDNRQSNINRLYRSTITGKNNTGTFLGDSLYKLIWEPLLPYLQNINTVFYAPDGLLHKVAFHALPTPGKKILIDQYRLEQYTSIRQLGNRTETKTNQWTSVFLLGNADFNTWFNKNSVTTAATKSTTIAWNSLPGTGKEVSSLHQLFIKKGVKTALKTGSSATEESYKKLDGQSPAIMHIATHGFFLPDPKEDSSNRNGAKNLYELSNDPLIRSGIVVSGANNAWKGQQPPADVEDGVITAYEIAQMDLHQTQLVVLSACETALGALQGSEGVFGLQRAFKMAGVKNIVVSLWQVPDKETVELMTAFYSNLLSGKEVREAFYLAQKEMRSRYDPFFWAAFVLVE